jgi:hypothetical protein
MWRRPPARPYTGLLLLSALYLLYLLYKHLADVKAPASAKAAEIGEEIELLEASAPFKLVRIFPPAACVSILQRTSPYAAYVSVRQRTSAYVSIRQHTSA